MSIFRSRLGALLLGALLCGCSAPVVYTPNEATLDGMARDQREQLFAETLSRALKPRIVQVWIDDASYGYDSAQAVRDGFGVPMGYAPRRRIVYFANVRELRLYDNNAVFVFDTAGRLVDKLQFGYPDDAQRMIDLVASYRARRYAGVAEPPNPRRRGGAQAPPPYDPRQEGRWSDGHPYEGPPPYEGEGPPPYDDRPY